jgi:hypothetical protein
MNETEQKARKLLKKLGYEVQQIDWVGIKNNKVKIFEIKERELFEPPPFLGTGLDKTQLYLRMHLFKITGIRTILMVFEKGTNNVYWQYLDILEKGKYYDTKNEIRIYPIENFKKITLDKNKKG